MIDYKKDAAERWETARARAAELAAELAPKFKAAGFKHYVQEFSRTQTFGHPSGLKVEIVPLMTTGYHRAPTGDFRLKIEEPRIGGSFRRPRPKLIATRNFQQALDLAAPAEAAVLAEAAAEERIKAARAHLKEELSRLFTEAKEIDVRSPYRSTTEITAAVRFNDERTSARIDLGFNAELRLIRLSYTPFEGDGIEREASRLREIASKLELFRGGPTRV